MTLRTWVYNYLFFYKHKMWLCFMKPLLQRFGEQMRKCYILARTLILFNTQHAILRHTRITHDRVGYFKKKKKLTHLSIICMLSSGTGTLNSPKLGWLKCLNFKSIVRSSLPLSQKENLSVYKYKISIDDWSREQMWVFLCLIIRWYIFK